MRKSTTSTIGRTLCAAAAVAAIVAVPATADAKKASPGLKQATFKATLSGSQVTTWEYHHVKDRDDPCDASANGYGDQTIKFDAGRTFRITFTRPPKSDPDLFLSDGHPVALTTPPLLTVDATAERNGDVSVNYGEIDPDVCGDNGGRDENYVETPKDCGTRQGIFKTKFYYHDDGGDDGLFVPLPGSPSEKNHVKLEGFQYEWQNAGGEDSKNELRSTYVRCPLLLEDAYTDDAGQLYISPAKLNERALFNPRRKRFVVSGDHTANRNEGETSGRTILAWNLRLKRVK